MAFFLVRQCVRGPLLFRQNQKRRDARHLQPKGSAAAEAVLQVSDLGCAEPPARVCAEHFVALHTSRGQNSPRARRQGRGALFCACVTVALPDMASRVAKGAVSAGLGPESDNLIRNLSFTTQRIGGKAGRPHPTGIKRPCRRFWRYASPNPADFRGENLFWEFFTAPTAHNSCGRARARHRTFRARFAVVLGAWGVTQRMTAWK